MEKDEVQDIIESNRECVPYEIEDYLSTLDESNPEFDSDEDVLDDFDSWKEQEDIAVDKILEANYYSRL